MTEEENTKAVAVIENQIPLEKGLPAPRTLEQLYRVARLLARSQMVPESYQIKMPDGYEKWKDVPMDLVKQAVEHAAQKIAVATIMGTEIGLTMMAALRSIAVIKGTPSVYGDAVPALAQAHAPIADVKEYYTGSIKDQTRTAHCEVQRKDRKSPSVFSFSIEDAQRAGLWDNSKRPTWKSYPDIMLMARARRAYRSAAPGALMGLPTAEEVLDGGLDLPTDADTPEAELVPPIDESPEPMPDDIPPPDEPPAAEQTVEVEPVDSAYDGLSPPPEILEFITDQSSDPDDTQQLMQLFEQFTDELAIFYQANRAEVFDTMVNQGLELTWDKFQGWIREQKKKTKTDKSAQLQDQIDSAGAGPKDNIWARGGWKRQGGEKFRAMILNNPGALLQMPQQFQAEMMDRWYQFDLGDFPDLKKLVDS